MTKTPWHRNPRPGPHLRHFHVSCGSQVGSMEHAVLVEQSPLRGRRRADSRPACLAPLLRLKRANFPFDPWGGQSRTMDRTSRAVCEIPPSPAFSHHVTSNRPGW